MAMYDVGEAATARAARAEKEYNPISWDVYPEWLDREKTTVLARVKYHLKGGRDSFGREMTFSFTREQLLQLFSGGESSFALINAIRDASEVSDIAKKRINRYIAGRKFLPMDKLQLLALNRFSRCEKQLRFVALVESSVWLTQKYKGWAHFSKECRHLTAS